VNGTVVGCGVSSGARTRGHWFAPEASAPPHGERAPHAPTISVPFMSSWPEPQNTLVPEAAAILEARKRSSNSPWTFASEQSKSSHIEDPRRAWTRLLRASKLHDLLIHDLRRTLGSWQARTGASHAICAFYNSRWQVELFFKWIKQHMRIKRFMSNSENAVKTQVWCASLKRILGTLAFSTN
jgi:hypothetical protein